MFRIEIFPGSKDGCPTVFEEVNDWFMDSGCLVIRYEDEDEDEEEDEEEDEDEEGDEAEGGEETYIIKDFSYICIMEGEDLTCHSPI